MNNKNINTIVEELSDFIDQSILDGEESGLKASTPLLETGILNSLAMLSLLAFISKKFSLTIPVEDVVPENFRNLKAIAELIASSKTDTLESLNDNEQIDGNFLNVRVSNEKGAINNGQIKLNSGVEINFLKVKGASPTWLLLPGLGNLSGSFEAILQSLKDDNEAIAIDFPGFGSSSSMVKNPNYLYHIQSLLDLLDQNFIEPPIVLVSSSTSAIMATEIARQRPKWIHALVITSFGLINNLTLMQEHISSLSQSVEKFLKETYYRPPPLTSSLRESIKDCLNRPAYHSFFEDFSPKKLKKCFENLHVPTLFVAGENDKIISKASVEAAARCISGSQVNLLARCGHLPSNEQPEELLYLIRNFLKTIE